MIYGMELLIALRIQTIFINRSMKSRRVSTGKMLRRFGVMMLVHAVVLAIWFGVARPQPTAATRPLAGVGEVAYVACASSMDAFVTIHLFGGGAIALWSLYVAVS